MSTRLGRLVGDYRPGLVTALLKVALIGTWKGRTFLDDDRDLADIADFVPFEPVPAVTPPHAAEATTEGTHSVAA